MRYRIKGGPLVLFAQMFCFLYLNLKESNPAYLSEKKPFKCVVRPREHLINCFLWTYTLIKWSILTSKLQKHICTNRANKINTSKITPNFCRNFKILLSSQPACCLLSIIACNTTNVVTSRVKLLEKPF